MINLLFAILLSESCQARNSDHKNKLLKWIKETVLDNVSEAY